MVTITNYSVHLAKDGRAFVALELTGDVEMVQSAQTGRFYATARRCSISSTFTEDLAKTLIGKQIRGRIERVACEAYEYTVPETGEIIALTHGYVYNPDEKPDVISAPPVVNMVAA
jgi:hypothetical protein